jgi:hypothetical protein
LAHRRPPSAERHYATNITEPATSALTRRPAALRDSLLHQGLVAIDSLLKVVLVHLGPAGNIHATRVFVQLLERSTARTFVRT